MSSKISVVINTFNEAENLARAIKSVAWADEIIVCDMFSSDRTVEVAKKSGAKVVSHEREEFVERARNFAVSKAVNDWVLVLDPDEEIPSTLAKRLQEMAKDLKQVNYVRIPRKNIIFGRAMSASMWWPDYNVRFFRKGQVSWGDKIHRSPEVKGSGIDLPAEEEFSIAHHHYSSIVQFLERLTRYTKVQAEELSKEGYKFDWKDLIKKPLNEFLSRFFANRGFEDGLHGLALAFLQSFSFLIVYLRIWEMEGFKTSEIDLKDAEQLSKESAFEINYWFNNVNLSGNAFKRFFQRMRKKI